MTSYHPIGNFDNLLCNMFVEVFDSTPIDSIDSMGMTDALEAWFPCMYAILGVEHQRFVEHHDVFFYTWTTKRNDCSTY